MTRRSCGNAFLLSDRPSNMFVGLQLLFTQPAFDLYRQLYGRESIERTVNNGQ